MSEAFAIPAVVAATQRLVDQGDLAGAATLLWRHNGSNRRNWPQGIGQGAFAAREAFHSTASA